MSIHLQASVKASWDGDALARLTGTAEGLLQSLDCSLQRRKVTKGCWPCRITFDFLSFFTRASTAFSAHFSSSSPCFHPRSFLTAGEVNEKRELRLVMVLPCKRNFGSLEKKRTTTGGVAQTDGGCIAKPSLESMWPLRKPEQWKLFIATSFNSQMRSDRRIFCSILFSQQSAVTLGHFYFYSFTSTNLTKFSQLSVGAFQGIHESIASIANALPITLYSRITM